MKLLLIILLSFVITGCTCTWGRADSTSNSLSLALPSSNTGYQSDSFRDSDGNSCSNSIGSATQLEFGVTGIVQGATISKQSIKDIGVYSRIIIPLGAKQTKRIVCNRLYELTLQQKTLEIMRLQQEINKLKALAFEN